MTRNKRYLLIIGLLIMVGTLPWFCHFIWESTTSLFKVRSIFLNLIIHFIIAIFVGILFFRFKFKLTLLIPIILVIISTSLLWNINRFELHKLQYQKDEIAIHSEPECYKEINYKNYWDYINNGCHVSVTDLVLSLTYRMLIWSLTIVIIKYVLTKTRTVKKVDNLELLD